MANKADEIVSYIMQRCLWQFHSREWDRTANIEGIMSRVAAIYTGEEIVNNTDAEKCYYADAKILAEQLKEKSPWISETSADEIKAIIESVKEKLTQLTITNCLNSEIKVPFY